ESVSGLIAGFLDRYPKVRLQLLAIDRPVDLIAERIDLALRGRTALDSDASLTMRTLGTSVRILGASPPLASRVAGIDRLSDLPLRATSDEQQDLEWPLETDDGQTRIIRQAARMGCGDFSAVRAAAMAGVGVALLPDHVCRDALLDGRLVRVLPAWRG